jgi:DNA-binding Lrp family transcriptional regulator
MDLTATDRRLLAALEDGLPLHPAPYAALGAACGLGEAEVLDRLRRLTEGGVIRRLGVVVRHRPLGYRANAMVVWDVAESVVDEVGRAMARRPGVTLCYRRPRRPTWPYTLFCMIHGRDRAAVAALIADLSAGLGLDSVERAILFSRTCFKQRGARYGGSAADVEAAA